MVKYKIKWSVDARSDLFDILDQRVKNVTKHNTYKI